MSDATSSPRTAPLRVLVYSDDVNTRQQVILALGRRPHPDLPELEYVEVATEPVVISNMDSGTIDLAILPINGKVGNMSGREAAQLAKDIGAKIVIPCHYDMFEFNTADPAEEFIPECERLGQPYRVLQQGERFSSTEIPA